MIISAGRNTWSMLTLGTPVFSKRLAWIWEQAEILVRSSAVIILGTASHRIILQGLEGVEYHKSPMQDAASPLTDE
jgi:hypothetical protein